MKVWIELSPSDMNPHALYRQIARVESADFVTGGFIVAQQDYQKLMDDIDSFRQHQCILSFNRETVRPRTLCGWPVVFKEEIAACPS